MQVDSCACPIVRKFESRRQTGVKKKHTQEINSSYLTGIENNSALELRAQIVHFI